MAKCGASVIRKLTDFKGILGIPNPLFIVYSYNASWC